MKYRTEKNSWGFYSVSPLPSSEELKKHYSEKYYQNEHGSYQHVYTDDEIKYFEIEAKVAEHIFKKFNKDTVGKLLDIGAGEGYFAKVFYENNWDVTTCDFSAYGMKQHNPSLLNTMMQGNIFETLEDQINYKRDYDFINLKNVLEHVLDPVSLLQKIQLLLKSNSLLRIEVPNDYSSFQEMLLEQGMTKNTWFAPPEHLHYFNFKSITNILTSLGFTVRLMMADFAIELYLLNNYSNYAKNKDVGKEAHLARVAANNFIYEQGIDSYINYYSACAEVDLGRQVIVYASKSVQ